MDNQKENFDKFIEICQKADPAFSVMLLGTKDSENGTSVTTLVGGTQEEVVAAMTFLNHKIISDHPELAPVLLATFLMQLQNSVKEEAKESDGDVPDSVKEQVNTLLTRISKNLH